jgi:hypothetical protein
MQAIMPPRVTLREDWFGNMLRDWPNKELVAYFMDQECRYKEIAQSRADQDVRDQFAAILNASPLGRHHRVRNALPEAAEGAAPEVAHEPDDTLVNPWDDTQAETEQWERFVADNPVP